MNWVPLVQLLLAAFVALWGVPAAWEYWSREGRLAARIERNTKAIAVVDSFSAGEVLRNDVRASALELAAIRAVPWRVRELQWLIAIAVLCLLLLFSPGWILPSTTTAIWACGAGLAILGFVGAPKWRAVRAVRQLRREFVTENSSEGITD